MDKFILIILFTEKIKRKKYEEFSHFHFEHLTIDLALYISNYSRQDKMNEVLVFRSPMSPRPYYYNQSMDTIEWNTTSNFERVDPMDGLFYEPSNEALTEFLYPNTESKVLFSPRSVKKLMALGNLSFKKMNEIDSDNPILKIADEPDMDFYSIPYLPFDLAIHEKMEEVYKFMAKNVSSSVSGRNKKKLSIDELLSHNKTGISGALYKETPNSANALAVAMFKSIHKFKQQNDLQYVEQIVRLVEGNKNTLATECAFQLITETNCTTAHPGIIRAWKLMMIVVGKYDISNPLRKYLRSYLIIAASSKSVSKEIRNYALICLIRLSAEGRLSFQYQSGTPISGFFNSCTSLTQIFGVTLSEILAKEDIRGLMRDKDDHLVPQILMKLVAKMLELNAPNIEGIFRIPGNNIQETEMAAQINSGDWEVSLNHVHTVASLTKKFVRELQDPMIPNCAVSEINENDPPSKVIQVINGLPNPTRDSLLYFFGFLQHIAENESINKMTVKNIIISIGPMFVRSENITSLQEVKAVTAKRDFILNAMIENMNTSLHYQH